MAWQRLRRCSSNGRERCPRHSSPLQHPPAWAQQPALQTCWLCRACSGRRRSSSGPRQQAASSARLCIAPGCAGEAFEACVQLCLLLDTVDCSLSAPGVSCTDAPPPALLALPPGLHSNLITEIKPMRHPRFSAPLHAAATAPWATAATMRTARTSCARFPTACGSRTDSAPTEAPRTARQVARGFACLASVIQCSTEPLPLTADAR